MQARTDAKAARVAFDAQVIVELGREALVEAGSVACVEAGSVACVEAGSVACVADENESSYTISWDDWVLWSVGEAGGVKHKV